MAKGDKEKYQTAVQEDRNKQQARSDTFYNTIAAERPEIKARNTEDRAYVTSGYRSIFENPQDGAGNIRGLLYDNGQNPNQPAGSLANPTGTTSSGSSGSGDSGGGSSSAPNNPVNQPAPRYATEYGGYEDFSKTGGVDAEKLRSSLAGYNEMNNVNSGFSPEVLAALDKNRATYNTLATDGGMSRAILDENLGRLRAIRDGDITLDSNLRAGINADRARLSGFGESGGYDPAELAKARGTVDSLRQIGVDGGIPPEQMARIRAAQSGFQEFAQTGGYSERDLANIRNRGNSQIPAMLAEQNRQIATANRASGGAANAGAVRARMFRDAARAQTDNIRDTEIGIRSAVNAGRQWGTTGLDTSERNLGDIISRNRLAGYDAAAKYGNELEGSLASNRINAAGAAGELGLRLGDVESGIALSNRNQQMQAANAAMDADTRFQESATRNRLQALNDSSAVSMDRARLSSDNRLRALGGISSTNQETEKLLQQGRLAGLSGMTDISKALAAEEMQRAAMDSAANSARYASDRQAETANLATKLANERYLLDRMDNNRLAALGGLSNLYGTAPGELNAADRNQITMFGAGADASRNSLALEGALYNGPSRMDRAMQLAGVGSNIFRAFGGGGGGGGGTSSTSVMPRSTNPSYDWSGANSDNIGGSIDTGPGSPIWTVPDGGNAPPQNGWNPSQNLWWGY